MKGDFSKLGFAKEKHYTRVNMQQGRLQLDRDWNEQQDIIDYRLSTQLQDVVGIHGTPKGNKGFKIELSIDQTKLLIKAGRYYVNGAFCENEQDCLFQQQPYITDLSLPSTDGDYLFYLDTWQQSISYIHDSQLLDQALNGTDTTTRQQTFWQVNYQVLAKDTGKTPEERQAILRSKIVQPVGKLTITQDKPGDINYLLRLEVHQINADKTLNLKWDVENARRLAKIYGNDRTIESGNKKVSIKLSQLTQDLTKKDQNNLQPKENEWVEVRTQNQEYLDQPGVMLKIISFDVYTQILMLESINALSINEQNMLISTTPLFIRQWTGFQQNFKLEADQKIDSIGNLSIKITNQPQVGTYWYTEVRQGYKMDKKELMPRVTEHSYATLAKLTKTETNYAIVSEDRYEFTPLANLEGVKKDGDRMLGSLKIDPVQFTNTKNALEVEANITDSLIQFTNRGTGNIATFANNANAVVTIDNTGKIVAGDIKGKSLTLDTRLIGTQLSDGTINTTQLADNAVTNIKINDIDASKITGAIKVSNGNLGIGTTSPLSKLSITPGTTEAKITLWDGGSSTNHYGFGISGGQLNYHVDSSGAKHVFYAGGKNGNGTELMTIQGNGNVGIGTASPASKLQIVGGTDVTTVNTTGFLILGNHTDTHLAIDNNEIQARNASSASILYIQSEGGNTCINETTGNVGIGTGSPTAKLTVNGGAIQPSAGNTETSGIMFPRDIGGGSGDAAWIRYYARTGESTTLEIGTSNDGDDHIALMPSGNVGIGTASPASKLQIVGGTDVTTVNTTGFLILGNHTDTHLAIDNNEIQARNASSASILYIQSEGGNTCINETTGNVGIGTTTPSQKLEVNGNIKASSIDAQINVNKLVGAITTAQITDKAVTAAKLADGTLTGVQLSDGAISTVKLANNAVTDAKINDVDAGKITGAIKVSNGNLGIGTESPSYKLEVAGMIKITGTDLLLDNPERKGGKTGFRRALVHDVNDLLSINHGGDYTGGVSIQGNVGIGTATPEASLSINGGGKEANPNGSMHITNDCILFGGNNSGKEANSAQISAGKHVANSLNIVGMSSGSSSSDRKIDCWGEGGFTIHGSLKVANTTPVFFKRFRAIGYNEAYYNTGYSSEDYNAAIVGFSALGGDIYEGGATHIIRLYMYIRDNKWFIRADFATHGSSEEWWVDVMFIRKELSGRDSEWELYS